AHIIPQIQSEYDLVTRSLVEIGALPRQVAFSQRQPLLAERTLSAINRVLDGDDDAVIAADRYATNTELFGRVITGMLNGDAKLGVARVSDPDIRRYLQHIDRMYNRYLAKPVQTVLYTAPDIYQIRNAADAIFRTSQGVLVQATG
ncbi:chemotaxis protein, partial [Acinetobacter baumannii]|nr:chemotaxis protein [Acinetobacter baumannii]